MKQLILSRSDENLLDSALSITVATGTVAAGYDADMLFNGNWSEPFMLTDFTLDLRMEWATAVLPEFPVIGNSNLDVAATLEGHSSNSWGAPNAPPQLFGIPTRRSNNYFTSPFLDLSALTAQKWWRLRVTANTLAVIIGELWMGSTYRTFDNYLLEGKDDNSEEPVIIHQTPMKVELTYPLAGPSEGIVGSVIVNATDLDRLQEFLRVCRHAGRPFFTALDEDIDDALCVRYGATGLHRRPLGNGIFHVQLPLLEKSRGLSWV